MREDLIERLAAVEGRLAANGNFQSDADARTIREAIAALRPTGVKVKALEWACRDDTETYGGDGAFGSSADANFAHYWTYWDGRREKHWALMLGNRPIGWFEKEPAAKADAQADFERRILSALEPAATQEAWRVVEQVGGSKHDLQTLAMLLFEYLSISQINELMGKVITARPAAPGTEGVRWARPFLT